MLRTKSLASVRIVSRLRGVTPMVTVRKGVSEIGKVSLPGTEMVGTRSLEVNLIRKRICPETSARRLLCLTERLSTSVLMSKRSRRPGVRRVRNVLLLGPKDPVMPELTSEAMVLLRVGGGRISIRVVGVNTPIYDTLSFSGCGESWRKGRVTSKGAR